MDHAVFEARSRLGSALTRNFGRTIRETGEPRRNPATKPPNLAPRILPRFDHPKPHLWPLLCTTGVFRIALFYRYNLNLRRFGRFFGGEGVSQSPLKDQAFSTF